MRFNAKNIEIKVGFPDVAALCVMFTVGKGAVFCMALSSALAHEAPHLAVMSAFGHLPQRITFGLFGGNIQNASAGTSYKEDLLTAAAGPFINLCIAVIAFWLHAKTLCSVNTALCFVNLLPARPLDGDRILQSLIAMKSKSESEHIFDLISFFCQILLILLCAVCVSFSHFNGSVIIFSCYLLFQLIQSNT